MASFNLAAWFNRSIKKQRQLQDAAQTFILEPIYTPSGIADVGDDSEGVELPPDNVVDDLDSSSDTSSEDTTATEDSSSDTDSEATTEDTEEPVDFDEEETEELSFFDNIEAESESDTTETEFASTTATEATSEDTADETEVDTTSEDDTETDVTSEDDTEETVAEDDTNSEETVSEAESTEETDSEETVAEDSTSEDETEETVAEDEADGEADTVTEEDGEETTSEDETEETVAEDEVDGEADTEATTEDEETIAESDIDGETSPEDSEGETDTVAEDDVDEEADTEATTEDEELEEEEQEILDETPAFQLPSFDSGVFTVGDSGEVGVDFLYDGGKYQGEVAIFSLSGLEELELNSLEDFIAEAANRAASGSEQGHIVIRDVSEGAKFDGSLEGGKDWNSGDYRSVKTFVMKAGDKFAVMLVPDGSVSEVANNPEIGGAKRPLFSLSTANPNDEFHINQIVDVTGDGNTFVMEDMRADGSSDKDYNDLIFQVRGATGEATYIGDVIDAEDDWRTQDLGQALIAYAEPYVTPEPVEVEAGDAAEVTEDATNDEGEASEVVVDDEPVVEEVESESAEAATDEAASAGIEESQTVSEAEAEVTQAEDETEADTVDDTEVEVTDTVEETQTPEAQGETVDETDTETEQPATTTSETEATESDEVDLSQGFELGDEPQDNSEPAFVPPTFEFPKEDQPDIGIIDTGVAANNPDLDYENITLGTDFVDGDDNPLLAEGEGNEHGTHALGTIAAEQNNGEGIDGINDDAPIWVGRAIGSGKWAESLVEFVDHARESSQPNAVVNLSMDLTQVDADGNVTTRYELTPQEREAIEYARQNNVMIVAAAGNDGGVMSALGQASQEFDNIMTVGAAEQFDPDTSAWKGADRTNYSSYGRGLDVVAYGGTTENPQLSLTGEGTSGMAGTSVATAKVTGAVSQVWAANPELSYRQVVEIIRDTATDLGDTGNDAETGAGLLNLTAAVHLAKVTKPEEHSTPALLSPETWSGEGVFTPNERAVQSVDVTPEWRRQYHGWLNSSNPADTFSFQIDEPTSLQYSIDFPGNAVLRRNGKIILKGKYDGKITYAGADGKLSPGSYTLTIDRGGLPVESYKLIMNFIDGSQGQQTPIIQWLPAKPVVQPQPTPTPTPTPTPQPAPSPSPEEIAAKKRAADMVRAVYEANRQRLGNSRRDIQIFEQAFDGVNMPAVQYFDGGYIIWNGQKAIPYFTGTGNALPNINAPQAKPAVGIGTLTDKAPLGDYQYSGSVSKNAPDYYSFRLDKTRGLHFALRDFDRDLKVEILDAHDNIIATGQDTGTQLLAFAELFGNQLYRARISSTSNTPSNYRLVLNPGKSLGDKFAQDDSIGYLTDKSRLGDYIYSSTLDGDSAKYYRFRVVDENRGLIFALRNLAEDANVSLLDADGNVLARGRSTNDPNDPFEKIADFDLFKDQLYFIQVASSNGQLTSYDLVLNPGASLGSKVADGSSLGFVNKRQVFPGESTEATDYYRFRVTKNSFETAVALDNLKTKTALYLLDEKGNVITKKISPVSGGKLILDSQELEKGKLYFIKVVAMDGRKSTYDIIVNPLREIKPPDSSPQLPKIMSYGEFVNNWRSWSEYTSSNPFPGKGANCTWYAHGRMMQLGYSEYALDSMWGNAGTWDNTAARGAKVTHTPQVPSIAVWEAGVGGAGDVGHVAVVERVNSDGSILISESNWPTGNAYGTRTLYPNKYGWPSKFVTVPKA